MENLEAKVTQQRSPALLRTGPALGYLSHTILNHWLEAAWEKRGFGANAMLYPEGCKLGLPIILPTRGSLEENLRRAFT